MKNISYHHHPEMGVNLVLINPEHEQTYPWHIHTRHWTIGLLLRGHALLETQKGINRLQAGEHFIVPPHGAHHLILESQSSLATLCLEHSKLDQLDSGKLDTLIRAQAFASTVSETKLAELIQLAEKVHLIALSTNQTSHPKSIEDSLTQSMIEKPEEPCSIRKMAKQARLSPWHFLRRFQRETGMTPHAMQIACRISKARQLLLNHTPIAEAALACGFTDQSHMHKLFMQHHGLTPRAFVKAASKEPLIKSASGIRGKA